MPQTRESSRPSLKGMPAFLGFWMLFMLFMFTYGFSIICTAGLNQEDPGVPVFILSVAGTFTGLFCILLYLGRMRLFRVMSAILAILHIACSGFMIVICLNANSLYPWYILPVFVVPIPVDGAFIAYVLRSSRVQEIFVRCVTRIEGE